MLMILYNDLTIIKIHFFILKFDIRQNFWYNRTKERGDIMKILTLDLSTKQSGYAIGQNEKLIQHGYFTASDKNPYKRIVKMRDSIANLLKFNKISKIIMEEVRPEYNSHTNKILMYLQASVVIMAYEINPQTEFEFFGASQWRAKIKIKQGRGIKRNQLKPQDVNYVQQKYGIKVNDDEADAICILDAYWTNENNEINWE